MASLMLESSQPGHTTQVEALPLQTRSIAAMHTIWRSTIMWYVLRWQHPFQVIMFQRTIRNFEGASACTQWGVLAGKRINS